jgi:glycosyltransferase involved in cell wall biosynthesis
LIIYHVENKSGNQYASGIDRYIHILVEAFSLRNIPVTWVTAYAEEDQSLKENHLFLSDKKRSNLRFFFRLFSFSLQLKANRQTVFHLHHPYLIIPFKLFARKAKCILSLHSDQDERFLKKKGALVKRAYVWINKKCLRAYDSIISPSQYLKDLYADRYPLEKNDIRVIRQGIDLNIFKDLDKDICRSKLGFSQEAKMLLFVGRFEKEKRIGLLLDIFEQAQQKIDHLELLMIGTGSLESAINERKKEIRDIHLVHAIPQKQLVEYINCADLLVVTSDSEGGPLVVKEALACNVPVVSRDVGDVVEVIDGIQGCYVAKNDVNDFVEKIHQSLAYGKIDSRFKMEKYSSDIFVGNLVKLYQGITNN